MSRSSLKILPVESSIEPSTFVELAQLRAIQHPAKIAFRFLHDGEIEHEAISYSLLDLRSKAIGAVLQDRCRAGSRIILLLPSGIDYICAFLGCLYGGMIPVPCYPLSAGHGIERLTSIISDCRPSVALTSRSAVTRRGLAGCTAAGELLWIDVDSIDVEEASAWKEPDIGRHTLALLQYTSGSTSAPKGVAVTHANLLANERMICQAFGQDQDSVVVAWLPLYHDMGLIGTILQPIYAAASSVFMSPAAFLHRPLRWLEAISRYRATTSGGPDFAYRLCIEKANGAQIDPLDLSSWRVAFNGAEQIRASTLCCFAEIFSRVGFCGEAFQPCYGLAEATLFVTGNKATGKQTTGGEAATAGAGSGDSEHSFSRLVVGCGLAVSPAEVAIVDAATMRRKPEREIGEIWVSGPNVAQGYYNQPELTNAVFRAQIDGEPNRAYLRTGDLGFLDGGELYVTGRIKDLIIVRGENHHPRDIELTAVESCPELGDALGAVFTVQPDHEQVVLVQEIPRHARPDFGQLAARISAAVSRTHGLALYDIVFVKHMAIPRTSSGKVQRHACRKVYSAQTLRALSTHKVVYSDNRARAEHHLADIIAESDRGRRLAALESYLIEELASVLNLDSARIDLDASLASLGLDSLAAAGLKSDLEMHLKISVPVSEFLSASSIRALAVVIEMELSESPAFWLVAQGAEDEEVIGRGEDIRLSPEQERLWLLEQIHPGSSTYNLSAAIRILGPLDLERLEVAVNGLIRRHQALRSTFALGPDGPVQRLAALSHVGFHPQVRAAAGEGDKKRAIRECLGDEQRTGFDLVAGPVARFRLIEFAPKDHVLLVTAHHIVTDAWSFRVMVRDLAALYNGVMPEVERHLADLAGMQGRRLAPRASDADVDYWTNEFSGPPPIISLPGQQASVYQASERRDEPFEIRKDLTLALREKSRETGHTPFTYLAAAFVGVLSHWAGQGDVAMGIPLWGRDGPGTANLVGLFAYPALLRVRIEAGAAVGDLLNLVRDKVLGALRHSGVPFSRVMELAHSVRQNGGLFSLPVLFSLLPPFDEVYTHDGVTFRLDALDGGDQDVGLFVAIRESSDCIYGEMRFDARALDSGMVRRVIAAYLEMLDAMVCTPVLPFESLDLDLNSPAAESLHSLAIVSTFTAEPLEEVLRFWSAELKTPFNVSFAPYGQVFQQLLDPGSLLGTNQAGTNCVLVRLSDWSIMPEPSDPAPLLHQPLTQCFDSAKASEFITALRTSAGHSASPYIVCFVPSKHDSSETQEFFAELERRIGEELCDTAGVTVLTSQQIAGLYPVASYYDRESEELGHIPFTPLYFAALGTAIVRALYSLHSPRYKVIAVDCDQTLWSGVCGEDGPGGVRIGEERRRLQEFLVQQHDAGILLCLCSKNHIEDVAAVFEYHSGMPLKRAHFISEKINWRPKPENLRRLAAELGLGLDSFIFIDDNPIECAEVQAHCSDVLVLGLPANLSLIPEFFSRIWAFDPRKISNEDRARASFYRQETSRSKCRRQSRTMLDFLRELELDLAIDELSTADLSRASQLSYRTNQFNSTGLRHSEAELRAWTRQAGSGCLTVRVADRFGDYGLVGLVLYRLDVNALVIEGWWLSCRALGRGVEQRIVTHLGQFAVRNELDEVVFRYRKTAKNIPALNFFIEICCTESAVTGEDRFFVLMAGNALNCLETANKKWEQSGEEATPMATAAADQPVTEDYAFTNVDLPRIARELYSAEQVLNAVKQRHPQGRARAGASPRTPTERILAEIWSDMLNVQSPSVDDNFFEAGGNSILGVRFLAEIQRRFSVELPAATFFTREPTIAELASAIEDQRIAESNSEDISALLDEFELLSDDDIRDLLAREQ